MPSTREEIAATKAAQRSEAMNREKTGQAETDGVVIDRAAEAAAGEGQEDGLVDTGGEQRQEARGRETEQRQEERAAPKRGLTPGDDKRANIINRMREQRQAAAEEGNDADDILAFANQGLPRELVAPEQEEDPAEVEAAAGEAEQEQPARAPAKIKVKVRGEERELTIEELTQAAQRGLAGDEYLNEARSTLDSVKNLKAQIEAERTGQPAKHPGEQTGTHAAEETSTEEGAEHPGDPLLSAVEAFQLGSPDEGAKKLREILDRQKQEIVEQIPARSQETLQAERIRDEDTRSQEAQREFQAKNTELAANKHFRAAVEVELYDQQMADLKELGVDEAKMRAQLKRDPTVADVAQWHRWYRASGFKVRSASSLLDASRDAVLEAVPAWKPKTAVVDKDPQPAQRAEQTKVAVTVNRDARRAALRPQPTRTVTPRPAQPAAPKETDRSAIVQNMIADRNRPRGRVTA